MMAGNRNQGDKKKPRKNVDLAALNEQLNRSNNTTLKKAMEDIAPHRKSLCDVEARMDALRAAAGEDSTLGRISKHIAEQQRAIDAVKATLPQNPSDLFAKGIASTSRAAHLPEPELSNLKIPPNPINETNERLERIEDRFAQMQGIAADAAHIATGLQASAAEFLQKFEEAAADNNRATRRVIWIGVFALIIAIAAPISEFLFGEYHREPGNGLEIQAALEGIQAEMTATREAQIVASRQLEDAMSSSSGQMTAVLREIHDLLSGRATRAMPSPDTQNSGEPDGGTR